MKTHYSLQFLGLTVVTAMLAAGCGKSTSSSGSQTQTQTPAKPKGKSEYVFAMAAKSQSNPVFQSARVGAEDAAAELSKQLGMKISVLWRTPNEQDAQKQVEYLEQMVLQGVDGISVSCIEADALTPAINRAVD